MRGREVGGLLVHVLTPITHIFLPYSWFPCFHCFFFLLFLFSFFSLDIFSLLFRVIVYYAHLWLLILLAVARFTIFIPQLLLAYCGCPFRIAHWFAGCLATTTTMCWPRHTSFPNEFSFFFFFYFPWHSHPDKG